MIEVRVVLTGSSYTIMEIVRDGKSLVETFLKGLEAGAYRRIRAKIAYIAEHGPPANKEKFVPEQDGIFAIKDYQTRVYCFFGSGRQLFLTNGAIKKTQRARKQDLKRACRLRDEYKAVGS